MAVAVVVLAWVGVEVVLLTLELVVADSTFIGRVGSTLMAVCSTLVAAG